MKATAKTTTEITLILTGPEAKWLQEAMSRPLPGELPQFEGGPVNTRRFELHDALRRVRAQL